MPTLTADELFGRHGAMSVAHPAFEFRDGQLEMAQAVERIFTSGGELLVEAGTGTGKTLAYLAPAVQSGRRVVISTATRNLQEQIARNDVPFLQERLGLKFTGSKYSSSSTKAKRERANRTERTRFTGC